MIERIYSEELLKRDLPSLSLIKKIVEIDKQIPFENSAIYHQFPIYPNQEGDKAVNANVLFISKNHGIIIFECVGYSSRGLDEILENTTSNLDEIDRLIFAKVFKDAPNLQKNRRSLKVEIMPAIYLDDSSNIIVESDKKNNISDISHVSTQQQILELINSQSCQITSEEFIDLKATIEGSKGILRLIPRKLRDKNDLTSKGAILTKIESAIYNFDQEQKRAALFTLDGAQRIRGLAGSGKTIILSMKAAQIHLQNPEAEILYTYYTKNLYDLVRRLITRFYRQFAEKDPNWDKIHIMHAWGGAGLEGVYSNACNYNNVPFINLNSAKFKAPRDPFGYVCEQLNEYELKKQYDYALLDEAQDFPLHFYRVCRQITKNNRVVWAYDDFQNILDVNLQSEKETFGKDEHGQWYIDFDKRQQLEIQDLILHKCYRNPKEILIAAFALGLGIYNWDDDKKEYKVLQRLENNEHWESLGFEVEKGTSKDGELMVLSRPDHNSSELKNQLLTENLITVVGFKSYKEEAEFVAQQILEDLKKELLPEDISVICVDNRYAKKYFSIISAILSDHNVPTFNLQQEPSDTIIFKIPEHVTLSTIYKAKGNESGSVYILGIDSIFWDRNDITERNKIFTAMTRSLGWVTISGLQEGAAACKNELDLLKSNDYKLIFKQPSQDEVKTIRQDINNKQSALNKIERFADQLSNETSLSKDEIVDQLRRKLDRKK